MSTIVHALIKKRMAREFGVPLRQVDDDFVDGVGQVKDAIIFGRPIQQGESIRTIIMRNVKRDTFLSETKWSDSYKAGVEAGIRVLGPSFRRTLINPSRLAVHMRRTRDTRDALLMHFTA
jgi:hypothetical protein